MRDDDGRVGGVQGVGEFVDEGDEQAVGRLDRGRHVGQQCVARTPDDIRGRPVAHQRVPKC
ncbi:hypothetical protein IQ62_23620 [Streptomyces scabiei]|uniref:hypothetical protein n=1 Tax=Streptomyces scabiei TaxID=1930 RepID=UPI0004E672F7|nr:hypothetical protein [Streptomyces scabiei]KFF98749.1 hypothetical protein IQ62_23620 [Streptomyces scabiei]